LATYTTAVTDDNNYLNGAGTPCVIDGTGPFNNVIDETTQQQFCSSNGTGGTLVSSRYNNLSNSQIAALSTVFFQQQSVGSLSGFVELYAQAFAYQTFVSTLPPADQVGYPFTVTVNGLFYKQYYQCAQQVAAQIAGISFPTPPYSCN